VTRVTVDRNVTCNHEDGRRSMAQVIQVEVRTGTTHTVTWLDTALKTKPGMVLVCKGDPRRWSVVYTYGIAAREVGDSNIDWKVAGCEAQNCVA
jgi:hypothetical protein